MKRFSEYISESPFDATDEFSRLQIFYDALQIARKEAQRNKDRNPNDSPYSVFGRKSDVRNELKRANWDDGAIQRYFKIVSAVALSVAKRQGLYFHQTRISKTYLIEIEIPDFKPSDIKWEAHKQKIILSMRKFTAAVRREVEEKLMRR